MLRRHRWSSLFLGTAVLLLLLYGGLRFVALPLIESAYRGEAWPVFNRLIKRTNGEPKHPLARYHYYLQTVETRITTGIAIFAALGVISLLARPAAEPANLAARPPASRWRRLAINGLLLALIGGHFASMYQQREYWPVSHYPMYSRLQPGKHEYMILPYGVAGSRRILLYGSHYWQPYGDAKAVRSLIKLAVYERHRERVEQSAHEMLDQYERNRLSGHHNGPRLDALRICRAEWQLDANELLSLDRSDRKFDRLKPDELTCLLEVHTER